MQEVFNAAWYSQNELQNYPLLDGSLPSSIISDIKVSTVLNTPLYLAGVTNSEDLITVVICQDDAVVLSITLRKPIDIHRYYSLESYSTNVAGCIAFGTGASYNFGVWQLNAEEGELSPAAVVKRRIPPVTSLSKEGISSRMVGNLILSGAGDMQVTIGTLTIGEHDQRAIIFSAGSQYEKASETMRRYAGCCSARPDNNSDDDGCDCKGITSLGGAYPNSQGDIQIEVDDDIELATVYDSSTSGASKCGTSRATNHTILLHDSGEIFKPAISCELCYKDKCKECNECLASPATDLSTVDFRNGIYTTEGIVGYDSETNSIEGDTDTGTASFQIIDVDSVEYIRIDFTGQGTLQFKVSDENLVGVSTIIDDYQSTDTWVLEYDRGYISSYRNDTLYESIESELYNPIEITYEGAVHITRILYK